MSDDTNPEIPPAAAPPAAAVDARRLARTAGEAVDFIRAWRRLRADRAAATITAEEYSAALLALERSAPERPSDTNNETGAAPDAPTDG